MKDEATRVLIADGRAHARSAMGLLLAQEPGVAVVGKAADVEAALAAAAACWPDVVLLDWDLPGGGGAAALAALRAARPGLRVIGLSGLPAARREALRGGADGFVSKVDPPERLLEAVRRCAS